VRASTLSLAALAAAVVIVADCPPTWSASSINEPRSTISILVDLSQTWHNERSGNQNRTVLETVFEAAIELSKRYHPPTHIRVLPIGDASLMRPPLCDAVYDPKLISAPSKSGNGFTQETRLRKYLKADCTRFVVSRPREKFTDISGAIDSAARLALGGRAGDERALIVLSDMKEDLPRGQIPPELSLPGFRILIVYRVLPEDRRAPNLLDKRLGEWKARLTGAGGRVEVVPDQGVTPGQVGRLLRD